MRSTEQLNYPPDMYSLGRFLFDEVSVWADFWWARKGAMLLNFCPHVRHLYSRWAARRSWICVLCRFRFDFRRNDLSQIEHLNSLSFRCICSCWIKFFGRLKSFPQVLHSWRSPFADDESSLSYTCKSEINRIIGLQIVIMSIFKYIEKYTSAVRFVPAPVCSLCKVVSCKTCKYKKSIALVNSCSIHRPKFKIRKIWLR